MNLPDKTASLIDQLIGLCMHKRTHEKKTTIDVQFRKQMIFLLQNILILLKRGITDVNKSETSCGSKIIYGKIEHAGHVKYRAQS